MVSEHVGSKPLISQDGFCTEVPNPSSFIRVPNFLAQKLSHRAVSNDASQPFRLVRHTPLTWNNLAVQRSKPCGRNQTWKMAEEWSSFCIIPFLQVHMLFGSAGVDFGKDLPDELDRISLIRFCELMNATEWDTHTHKLEKAVANQLSYPLSMPEKY